MNIKAHLENVDNQGLTADARHWFVMRDLKRRNAKLPAYKMCENLGLEYFTPMVHRLVSVHGKRENQEVPFMQDLLFIKENRLKLDPIVENIPTLQYRYIVGVQHTPMVVREKDMERFIHAVRSVMLKRKIRIIGGPLDNYEGFLLTVRGSKVKRLLIELPTFLAASVEVEPEFIQLIK